MKVTWPLPDVVADIGDSESGPPESVTLAPDTLAPTQVMVATSETVGIAIGTVVVVPPTTVGLAVPVWPLLTAFMV